MNRTLLLFLSALLALAFVGISAWGSVQTPTAGSAVQSPFSGTGPMVTAQSAPAISLSSVLTNKVQGTPFDNGYTVKSFALPSSSPQTSGSVEIDNATNATTTQLLGIGMGNLACDGRGAAGGAGTALYRDSASGPMLSDVPWLTGNYYAISGVSGYPNGTANETYAYRAPSKGSVPVDSLPVQDSTYNFVASSSAGCQIADQQVSAGNTGTAGGAWTTYVVNTSGTIRGPMATTPGTGYVGYLSYNAANGLFFASIALGRNMWTMPAGANWVVTVPRILSGAMPPSGNDVGSVGILNSTSPYTIPSGTHLIWSVRHAYGRLSSVTGAIASSILQQLYNESYFLGTGNLTVSAGASLSYYQPAFWTVTAPGGATSVSFTPQKSLTGTVLVDGLWSGSGIIKVTSSQGKTWYSSMAGIGWFSWPWQENVTTGGYPVRQISLTLRFIAGVTYTVSVVNDASVTATVNYPDYESGALLTANYAPTLRLENSKISIDYTGTWGGGGDSLYHPVVDRLTGLFTGYVYAVDGFRVGNGPESRQTSGQGRYFGQNAAGTAGPTGVMSGTLSAAQVSLGPGYASIRTWDNGSCASSATYFKCTSSTTNPLVWRFSVSATLLGGLSYFTVSHDGRNTWISGTAYNDDYGDLPRGHRLSDSPYLGQYASWFLGHGGGSDGNYIAEGASSNYYFASGKSPVACPTIPVNLGYGWCIPVQAYWNNWNVIPGDAIVFGPYAGGRLRMAWGWTTSPTTLYASQINVTSTDYYNFGELGGMGFPVDNWTTSWTSVEGFFDGGASTSALSQTAALASYRSTSNMTQAVTAGVFGNITLWSDRTSAWIGSDLNGAITNWRSGISLGIPYNSIVAYTDGSLSFLVDHDGSAHIHVPDTGGQVYDLQKNGTHRAMTYASTGTSLSLPYAVAVDAVLLSKISGFTVSSAGPLTMTMATWAPSATAAGATAASWTASGSGVAFFNISGLVPFGFYQLVVDGVSQGAPASASLSGTLSTAWSSWSSHTFALVVAYPCPAGQSCGGGDESGGNPPTPTITATLANDGYTYTFTLQVPTGYMVTTAAWNFGDGTTGTGNPVTHTFALGTYTVTATVTFTSGYKVPVTSAVAALGPAQQGTDYLPLVLVVGAVLSLLGVLASEKEQRKLWLEALSLVLFWVAIVKVAVTDFPAVIPRDLFLYLPLAAAAVAGIEAWEEKRKLLWLGMLVAAVVVWWLTVGGV